MVRPSVRDLPERLVKFFKSLKAHSCSVKWNWAKVLEVLQSDSRRGSGFWRICEAGIYHIMYCGSVDKNTDIKCKKVHSLDIRVMEYVGVCFSHLMLTDTATNRMDKFKLSLQQVVSTLLDAAISAFKTSGFHISVLEPLMSVRDPKLKILPRLLTIDKINVKNKLELALCRIYVLSSTLRSIFENGSTTVLPICLPYICFAICAIFSVNICDPRHSSSALMACAKHLLHSFCVVVRSCGINISPAAPSLMTSLVYQLEWSSQFARQHPSKDSLTYKLAVYRCLSSFLDATAQVASPSLFRLTSRIIFEVCFDISFAARGSLAQSLVTSSEDMSIYELHVCCVAASIRLIELLFVNHSFILSRSMAEITDHSVRSDNNFCDYKFKQALLSLSSELHYLATRLVNLLSKPNKLTPPEQVIVKPHFLILFLNTASAVRDYGFLFPRSNVLHELTRVLLKHNDYLVRINAERCYRHTFKSLSDTTFAKLSLCDGSSLVSSFTQTEQSLKSLVSMQQENDGAPALEAWQEQAQLAQEPLIANTTFIPDNCALLTRVEMTGTDTCEAPLQEMSKPSNLLDETTQAETPAPSKRVKKRAHSEDPPPIPAKKTAPETVTQTTDVEKAPFPEACPQKAATPEEGLLPIQDVLCTFDDTLI
ncbi:conserved hypothetical protein [Echinococcus multilocularis]|uniref:DUF5742 domain-containing protein n=1 Tax=Echinococcus multilocularis TaxID=6211 RepID=A0A068YA03_ECHMU|nr:conserved hypothetical protein [Echinococcus multilocularis]